ncbi:MAG: SDR family NAD(P)-dependent oxidoreductase [Paracoccaceae bacterium]|nr:SDR family NAD(P)-dependent oxidoreductase [Paracoccaceae bacterium]
MGKPLLIVGTGPGLSASLARLGAREGMTVALAARNIDKLESLAHETGASLHQCDASKAQDVAQMFSDLDSAIGTPDMVVYNPSVRVRGPIQDLDPEDTKNAIDITCYGAFLVAQQAAKRMRVQGRGSILFTGASAGVKGFANSSVFAMGKFGLRGLAQALARELHPQNIHIGHFVIDGGIRSNHRAGRQDDGHDKMLDPDAIAESYLQFHLQNRSAWAWEIELRPWVERF